MKKFTFIFTLIIGALFLQSCEGPEGPRGVAGPPAEVFEVTTTFTAPNYESIFVFSPHQIYSSDLVLVYELSGQHNGRDIWKLLPQTYYFDAGVMSYNFDYTTHDFRIFMDSTFDVGILDSSWRNGITFRVVIVPGYFSLSGIDTSDINSVMGALSLDNDSIEVLNLE